MYYDLNNCFQFIFRKVVSNMAMVCKSDLVSETEVQDRTREPAAGGDDLSKMKDFVKCVPDHSKFIPVKDFSIEHLTTIPAFIFKQSIFDYVSARIPLVVKLSPSFKSTDGLADMASKIYLIDFERI